ncbi:MAG: hypothetical protein AAGG07_11225 [Planctomycetota bacterium]
MIGPIVGSIIAVIVLLGPFFLIFVWPAIRFLRAVSRVTLVLATEPIVLRSVSQADVSRLLPLFEETDAAARSQGLSEFAMFYSSIGLSTEAIVAVWGSPESGVHLAHSMQEIDGAPQASISVGVEEHDGSCYLTSNAVAFAQIGRRSKVQIFPQAEAAELLDRHLATMESRKIVPQIDRDDLIRSYPAAVHRDADRLKRLRLRSLRFYWVFATLRWRINRPIRP